MTEDEIVGCHHWLDGHEFEHALGVSDGQESLACCSPWGCKESDKTEWLNWTEELIPKNTSILINNLPFPQWRRAWIHYVEKSVVFIWAVCKQTGNQPYLHQSSGTWLFSVGKESAHNVGDLGSIPRLGRSPEEENGNPLHYCCQGIPQTWAWRAMVHGVARVRHDNTLGSQAHWM